MKTYIKIFLITGGLQFIGWEGKHLADHVVEAGFHSSLLPFYVFAACVIASAFLGIFLPLRWYETWKGKIMGIFLLPTNYTIFLLVHFTIRGVMGVIRILNGLPSNFG